MTFSQDLFDAICERIAEGESLRKICRDDDMPAKGTVLVWIGKSDELQDQYARAREQQAESIFEEILEIADDGTKDIVEDGDGAARLDSEHIQRSRLRVDARKWMLGKMQPKKYGDKLDLDVTGLTVTIATADADL